MYNNISYSYTETYGVVKLEQIKTIKTQTSFKDRYEMSIKKKRYLYFIFNFRVS